jgi:hypothetical protein
MRPFQNHFETVSFFLYIQLRKPFFAMNIDSCFYLLALADVVGCTFGIAGCTANNGDFTTGDVD